MTIENLIKDFLSYYETRNFKHQGLIVKKNALIAFTDFLRERLKITETEGLKSLTKADLENFAGYLQAKSLSIDTIRTYIQVSRCFLKHCGLTVEQTGGGKPQIDLYAGLPEELRSVCLEYVDKRSNEGYPASTTGRLAEHARNFLKYLFFERNVTRFIDLRKDDVKYYVKYLADQTDKKGGRRFMLRLPYGRKPTLSNPFLFFYRKKAYAADSPGRWEASGLKTRFQEISFREKR